MPRRRTIKEKPPPPRDPRAAVRASISDPMERAVAAALDEAGIAFLHGQNGLDFYLPTRDLYIEVKRMHSPRIADQMARADNVIAAQGVGAVTFLATLLRRWPHV